jgi:hypothetical protein
MANYLYSLSRIKARQIPLSDFILIAGRCISARRVSILTLSSVILLIKTGPGINSMKENLSLKTLPLFMRSTWY